MKTPIMLMVATLVATAAAPAIAGDKMKVWVQANPDQPQNTDLQDSAQDIRKKLKSKFMELAPDAESSDLTITVIRRFYAPTGDYFVYVNPIDYSATVTEGAKATVQIMVEVRELDEVKFFSGQTWNNSWTGAANKARKNAEKWLKETFRN